MKLSELTNEVRKMNLKFRSSNKEHNVLIEYYPHRLNIPLYMAIRDEYTDYQRTISYLSELVKSWEFEDEAGNNIPATRESMEAEKIPYLILQMVLEAIWVDMSGMKQELRESKNA
jgi:hypothetical protein